MELRQPADEHFVLEVALPEERARLVRLCARLTASRDAAEDLAQETLIEAWRSAHKLTDPRGYSRWLSAVARNVCLRWLRRQRHDASRYVRLDYADGAAALALSDTLADDGDLTVDLERAELARLLDRALELLPPDTRRVMIERCIEESPQAEVAARLGLSEGAVAVRLHRGKLALRRLLSNELRDEAGAYGFFVPDTGGWQETRIWCITCGRRHVLGRFHPASGELILRCPGCHTEPGLAMLHHINRSGLFASVNGYKAALSRVLRWANTYYRPALRQGTAPCHHCGRPAPLRLGLPLGHPHERDTDRHCYVACARCGYPENNCSLGDLILGLPAGRRFWREHSQIRLLPAREVAAEGRPALLAGFESVTGPSRLEALVTPDTFDVLRIQTYPAG